MAREVDLREAAAWLGISERTVRRRLHRGELEGRQVSTPQGRAWRIRLDTLPPSPHGHDGGRTDSAALVDALRVVADQQQQLRDQAHQLLQLAGQVGYLQGQLEQLRALPAGTSHQSAQDGQQGASAAGVVVDDLVQSHAAPRRAWWRFW
jgi:excisionase family DNA binding protein